MCSSDLASISLADLTEKVARGAMLTAGELAVHLGVGYATALNWFKLPTFPS